MAKTFQALDLRSASGDVAAARLAARTILRRKGRVLDAAANSVAALRSRLDPGDHELLDDLAKVRSAVAARALGGATPEPPERRREAVQALTKEMEALEAKISLRSAAFRAEDPSITIERVQALIPEGAAFVELGEAAPINALVAELRAALSNSNRDPRPAARRLDALVMEPLRPLLGDARSILMSPDGVLNLIPFAALVGPDDEYLVKRYLFTYLTSGRDLLRRGRAGSRGADENSVVVVANPEFGVRPARTQAEIDADGTTRGLDRAALMRRTSFPPLPDTAVEGSSIASKMKGRASSPGRGPQRER